ncbi:hypothetical protein FJ365_00800, partial [Candidatus Dependentiae bacterium]|nr:hypothetical protein [Candidatus Dependentiae bacterium]
MLCVMNYLPKGIKSKTERPNMLKQLVLIACFLCTIVQAKEIEVIEHAESMLIDRAPTSNLAVYFSPNDKITEKLISLLDNAKKSIYAAVYMLTDKKIAEALVRAKERGVFVQLIIDPVSTGVYGKADYFAANGISLFVYQPPPGKPWFNPIMHNKFACIDDSIAWTGSFNWTVSANSTNEENVVISTQPAVCKVFRLYFEALRKTKTLPFVHARQNTPVTGSLHERVS